MTIWPSILQARFPSSLVKTRARLLSLSVALLVVSSFALAFSALGANRFATNSTAATLPSGFTRVTVASGLTDPVQTRFAPNGDMYIAEQCGTIRLIHNGTLVSTPVISIPNTQCDNERGLLAIALDGNFASNGYLYAAYTNSDGHSRLSRFTVVNGVANPSTEDVLYEFATPSAQYHNIDDVEWGPDGKLWVSVGDGYTCGSACGTQAQVLTSPDGKVLRMNPDGSVPSDNPYPTAAIPQSYVWALGFRSPFRFTFMANGALMLGDVGVHAPSEDKWQRFYYVPKLSNFGWSSFEYHQPCTSPAQANLSNCPFYEYYNDPVGSNAITGFLQYEGNAYPSLYQNALFYSEYGSQTLHYLTFTDSSFTTVASDTVFDSAAGTTVDLEMGPDGDLYSTAIYQGSVYKYVYSGPPNPTPSPTPLQVNNLVVNDSANAGNWSIQSNLQVGNTQYGDQPYTLASVPSTLLGADWIRTANASDAYTGTQIAHFTINVAATIYVAVDSRLPKPAWMDSSWVDTGTSLANNAPGGPFPQTLYARTFGAGSVILGPDASAATSDLMYTVIAVPVVSAPTPTPPPTPLQFSSLQVYDTTNAAKWSLQTNIQVGDVQYGDRGYTLTSVPASLAGAAWIRTANNSKTYTGTPTVSFAINEDAMIYVAIDNRQAPPSWIDSSWTNTGLTLTNTEASPPFTQTLFAKDFPAGTVSLGPVSNNSANTFLMYTVIGVPTGGGGTPTPTPTATATVSPTPTGTPTITPTPVPVQLSNLVVNDTTNAVNWSLRTNLQVGDRQYGDRGYTFSTVPSSLVGAAYIRAANSSKTYTGNPTVSFTISQSATIYVALDSRLAAPPSWIDSSWTNTGLTLTDSQPAGSNTFVLYSKTFPAGSVSLGPNGGGAGVNMYTVIVP